MQLMHFWSGIGKKVMVIEDRDRQEQYSTVGVHCCNHEITDSGDSTYQKNWRPKSKEKRRKRRVHCCNHEITDSSHTTYPKNWSPCDHEIHVILPIKKTEVQNKRKGGRKEFIVATMRLETWTIFVFSQKRAEPAPTKMDGIFERL